MIEIKVKGILLAGGEGSRLLPLTKHTNKTLIQICGVSIIDYAMEKFRQAGITEIVIIGNKFTEQIINHLEGGESEETIHYVVEEEPRGVLNAVRLARPYVEGCRIMLYFSDNITNYDFNSDVERFSNDGITNPGAVFLTRPVDDPSSFGICKINPQGQLIDIVEKPVDFPSNIAIGGIYLYDEMFWEYFDRTICEMDRVISISDINRIYLKESKVKMHNLGDCTWVDCGTSEGLLEATRLVSDGIIAVAETGDI